MRFEELCLVGAVYGPSSPLYDAEIAEVFTEGALLPDDSVKECCQDEDELFLEDLRNRICEDYFRRKKQAVTDDSALLDLYREWDRRREVSQRMSALILLYGLDERELYWRDERGALTRKVKPEYAVPWKQFRNKRDGTVEHYRLWKQLPKLPDAAYNPPWACLFGLPVSVD
jgi:hypothetical protein